jgi:hypothetical protein
MYTSIKTLNNSSVEMNKLKPIPYAFRSRESWILNLEQRKGKVCRRA